MLTYVGIVFVGLLGFIIECFLLFKMWFTAKLKYGLYATFLEISFCVIALLMMQMFNVVGDSMTSIIDILIFVLYFALHISNGLLTIIQFGLFQKFKYKAKKYLKECYGRDSYE